MNWKNVGGAVSVFLVTEEEKKKEYKNVFLENGDYFWFDVIA